MELYEKNGKIGVLVSPEFGAGWSSWEGSPELAYDKRIIEFWLAHKDDEDFMKKVANFDETNYAKEETKEFFSSIGYPETPYLGGFEGLVLKFVPRGVPWRIVEYDGSEHLELFNEAGFITF